MAIDLFKGWLPSIMQTKTYIFTDEVEAKEYDSYMINRALALSQDRGCLFYANQVNLMCNEKCDLPARMQYDYLMGTIRKARRPYVPWPKKISDENLRVIMRHFGYSQGKALNALKILTEEQVTEIKNLYKEIKV